LIAAKLCDRLWDVEGEVMDEEKEKEKLPPPPPPDKEDDPGMDLKTGKPDWSRRTKPNEE
jgi:hypothetical protein